MQLQSLGYATDLILTELDRSVRDRGEYLVVRTPANPGFYWGNLLVFRKPPAEGDLERWDALFREEFANDAEVHHRTFGWDTVAGEAGLIEPFVAAGYMAVNDPVLAMDEPPEPRALAEGVVARELDGDADWECFRELNRAADERDTEEDPSYALFKRRQRDGYRRLVEGGLGSWFGAFQGERMVAGCGLFGRGATRRFQSVETHPDFRRRGLCSGLIREVCRRGLAQDGARRLVIVAGDGEPAEQIYKRIGFRELQRQMGAFLRPADVGSSTKLA